LRAEDALRLIVRELRSLEAPIALVGGLAVSTRSIPRFTADVDLAVAVLSDTHAERIVYDLRPFDYQVLKTIEHEATGRLAAVRLVRGGAEPIVDLLFSTCGIEGEIVAAAEEVEVLEGLILPVARTGHLVAMKLLSRSEGRPLDAADLVALRAALTPEEIARARSAVRLIEERGFSRGRDLVSALEEYLAGR
jgi:hypothetical protein